MPLTAAIERWIGPIPINETTIAVLLRFGSAVLTFGLALVLLRLLPVLERFVIARANGSVSPTEDHDAERRQRVATLARVTGDAARGTIWVLTIVALLDRVGIAVAPLLAGAGIAGVAIGFGAQSIVKDFFVGFFILLENQFTIGDTVTIAGVTGTVERMNLRVTVLRDAAGTAYFIPNSGIATVANQTLGWSCAILDVAFAASVPDDVARAALEAAGARAEGDPTVVGVLLGAVTVEGPLDLSLGTTKWRIAAKADSEHLAGAKQRLILALRAELAERALVFEGGAVVQKKAA